MRTREMGVKSISIFLALIISMIFCPSVSKGSVDPPTVDFGEVGVGSSSTITLQVTNNPNEEDLNVSFYMYDDAGCGFSIVSDVSEGVSLSAGQSVDVDIRYEPSGLPPGVVQELQRRGHVLEERTDISGDVQSIHVREDGTLLGAADRRRGGQALGY